MLEDFTMEKKSGRSGQSLVKGNGTESKKNPDSVVNKIYPRTSRHREPLNFQNVRNETNRKPVPQKSKSIDKRPRSRRYYGSGKEDTKVAEFEEELQESILEQASKKQNLNHLLNFHYAPRDGMNAAYRNWRANPGSRSSAMKSYLHKYNKEQFLQANCQFVVKANGDYSSYMVNPDTLVHWECIEQIRFRSSEMLSCPICLYPPVAAKMTRCGHVFCWPCILHYLALSDRAWRKCPICFEAVHKQDLKSVTIIPLTPFSVGDQITLVLMKRKRGSLIASPVNESEFHESDKLLYVSEASLDTKYSKLLLASNLDVTSIIEREKIELQIQLSENEDCPEACFIEQAFELLKEREISNGSDTKEQLHENYLLAYSTSNNALQMCEAIKHTNADGGAKVENILSDPVSAEAIQNPPVNFFESSIRKHYESVSSEGLENDEVETISVEDIEAISSEQNDNPGVTRHKDFYFYQAADGQHIYLHAINVHMLEHYYGCLKNCPLSLTGRIVEKESGSMTVQLRQRLRYMQHLPVTCQFEVTEILLKPPVVGQETIDHFQEQLEMRKRRRQRRERDERRREKRISEEENKCWGRYPSPNISVDSHRQFPSCSFEMDNTSTNMPVSKNSSSTSSPAHSLDAFASVSSNLENLTLDEYPPVELSGSPEIPAGPSFAQMLRDGKSKYGNEWFPSKTTKYGEHSSLTKKRNSCYTSGSESEAEGNIPDRPNFGDAIALAMEKAAAASSSMKDLQDAPRSTGKKKKKQKQKLLLVTGMACINK